MNKIFATLLTLLTINFPIFAQISGLSLGPRYSKTVTGRTSLFGAPSYSYNKLHADGFMQFEEVRHAGYYLYVNANPVNVGMTAINGKITLPSSHPKEGPMSSVDFTIAQHDVAWPIIGKNKNLNLGLGYSFLWKVEGLILENKESYTGVAKPGELDGNFDYGSGRFSAKHRMGLGPILDLKYVDNYEKYAIRTAVGSSLYGGAGGTYSFFQLAGYYQLNDKYALTLKHTRYVKFFSHEREEFDQEISDRLGDQLRVNTIEFYFGLMINMD